MQIELSGVAEHLLKKEVPKEMLSVSLLPDGRQKIRINSSSLSIIQDCGRKAWYSLFRDLRSNLESPATLFGSAIHKALEIFYLGGKEERFIPPKFSSMSDLMAYSVVENEDDFLLTRAIRGFVTKAAPLSALPDSDKRSISGGIWLLQEYFQTYIDDPYVVMNDKEGKPLVECATSYILYEDDKMQIEYFGTVDVILRNEINGTVLVCDHKTSSMVGKDFYNRLKPNHQYTGYILGARLDLGIDTDKFMVNCLQVKVRPKTARGTGPTFPRQVTTRSEEDFDEFREVVVDAVARYMTYIDSKVWPLGPTNACAMYGGCTYLDICSVPKSIRENIISAKYKEGV